LRLAPTFIAPIALALLVWRTIVEDRMLQRDLPAYCGWTDRDKAAGRRNSPPFNFEIGYIY
jgi:hypothetical protein